MADLSPPDDLVAPPNDLVDAGGPPADLATAVQPLAPGEVQDLGKTSALGAAGRGMVRGAAPAAGGLAAAAAGAEAGAGLGALTGPAAPFAVPILGFAGGIGGAYLGAEGVQRLQDAALAHMPESWRRALGQDTATQREDIQQHPYASFTGELLPNLALMRPGKIATAIPEGAGMLRRALSSPTAARLTSAGLMGAQEAGSEEAQQGAIDPGKVAIAAGAGAVMNRPTRAGEAVMSAATAPQRVLTNIARGRPADTPIVPPETVQPPNDLMPESTPAPQGHPAPGEAVGVRFKNAPPRRAEVDHYFDNGNAVRLRMDDGSYHDMTTADLARSRTEPPQPMPRPTEIQGKPPADVGMDEAPFPDDWYEPQGQPKPASKPTLGADMLNALDHADTLERTAMNGSLNLSAGARQDMLAEAGRLRRLFGHAGDETTMYSHPMAQEPARDLGELAAARTEAPQLYEGERRVPPLEARTPETNAPNDLLSETPQNPRTSAHGIDPYALEDVSTARAPMPKGESLFDAIRALGGIKDDRGDVAQIMQGFKNEPFKRRVLNPKGLPPDAIREALQEQGWFGNHDRFGPDALETGSYPGDDIRDLYDLMDREARGEKVYHPDSDTAQQMAYRQYLDEELSRAGVLHTDSNEQAARKLAQYRAERDADQHAWESSRAVEDDLHPEDLEALTGHGYEPGSDFGAELEEPSGHEGDAGRSPPADLIAPEDHGGGEQVAGGGEGPAEAHPADRPDLGTGVDDGRTRFQMPHEPELPEGYRFIEGRGPLGRGKWGIEGPDGRLLSNLHPTKEEAARDGLRTIANRQAFQEESERRSEADKEIANRIRQRGEITDADLRHLNLKPYRSGFEYLSPVVQRLFGISKARVREAMGDSLRRGVTEGGSEFWVADPRKALANAAKYASQKSGGEFAFERGTAVDGQGRPVDQFINEAGAHSAKQLAAAREAQGHGKIKPRTEQRGAGPLFGEEEPPELEQGSLFQVHHQTETPEFKRWFGDSKVVDKKGKPLVVYHGTPNGDVTFAPKEKGIYFTSSRNVGEGYTYSQFGRSGHRPAMYPAFLSLKNPLVIDALGKRYDNLPVPWQQWKPKVYGRLPADAVSVEKAYQYAMDNGHDGLIVHNVVDPLHADEGHKSSVYVVNDPAQIKSAIGNRGTFDPNNPSITAQSFGRRAGEAKGETVKLADDLLGRTLGNVSPEEAKLLNEIERMAEKIVPRASVRVMRALRMEPGMAAEAGVHPDSRISGATYANGLRRLIALSLESPDIRGTLKHEAVHYLRARGLISGKEWAALEKAAVKGDWLGKHEVKDRWATAPAWLQKEEAIAEEFGQWRRAPDAVPKMFRPMYERISRFMAKIADHTRRIFGRDVTADDVMSRMMSGEIGNRNRQEVERAEPAFAQAHLPSDMNEAGDRLDSAADDMAGELHGAPPGTYRRTLDRMMPPMGELVFKDPNAVQNVTLRPETMARLDSRSAAIWNTWKAKENEATTMVDDLRSRIADTMLKLNDTERNKVYAARELDRINNFTRTDTGHQIVVRNDGADFAHFSKPGDVVTLSPKETAAYHALTDMFDRSWKNVMEGAARKVGYTGEWDKDDMAANIQRLNETAANTADRGNAKVAARAAKIVAALDEQRRQGYHPLMRFGDYYAHVTPKMGTDEMSSGGFPRTVRFELAERHLQDSLTGGTRVGNQSPPYAKEMLDRLRAQYPADKFNIEHGYLAKNPEMLDRVDLPAIEKLMTFMENDMLHSLRQEARGRGMSKADARDYAKEKYDDLYGRMVDQLWEKAFKELESGYKKRSRTVPGYSNDFDRALGTYMHWTSRNVADQIHRENVDDAFTAMQTDPRVNADVKRYWNNWRDYQSQPSNIFNKGVNGMARWGFLTAMGLNPSSTAVVGAHGLFMAGPTLSVGIGPKAFPAYFKALGHAMSGVKVDGGGLHIDDVGHAARTPEEKAYLAKLDQEGMLHSRAIEDMAALNEKQSSLWGSARSQARKIMDMALSNVSVMDRANRIASALSSYRLAQDPKTFDDMDKAWSQNQIWRDIKARDGATPEALSRFMVSNMVGEYGRTNQAPIERNAISRMMLGMHGFVTRLLQAMWKMGSMGPEGQKALLWTLGAFWTMAGVDGIPFSQDVQNFADYLWKKATGKDPMIGYRIQAELASMFGKPGADMILHGPTSVFSGVDVASRLGLGDLISRNIPNPDNMLGAYPSIILGRAMAANSLIRSGQYEAAAAQAFPAGIRNLIVADAERRNGIRTRAGRPLVQQENVGAPETVARGLGFTPTKAQHAYERSDFRFRAKHSRMGAPANPIPQSKGGRTR